jgi:hypothetical protein
VKTTQLLCFQTKKKPKLLFFCLIHHHDSCFAASLKRHLPIRLQAAALHKRSENNTAVVFSSKIRNQRFLLRGLFLQAAALHKRSENNTTVVYSKKETDKKTYDSCFTVSLKRHLPIRLQAAASHKRSENNATVVFSKKKKGKP